MTKASVVAVGFGVAITWFIVAVAVNWKYVVRTGGIWVVACILVAMVVGMIAMWPALCSD